MLHFWLALLVNAWVFQQVLEIPPGAEGLGYSERTPFEVFSFGNHILGIQGHPEFEADVIIDIIETRLALGVISVILHNSHP